MTENAAPAPAAEPAVLSSAAAHPKGLYILFATEMWERFSYYGMRALLMLYMLEQLGWQPSASSSVYKWYTSLVYLTPLAGGYLADRYLGLRTSIVIGGVLMALGHFLMALPPLPAFYGALALLVFGNGFFKPNISTLVGRLYPEGDPRRDSAFTIFYMGINLGAGISPFVCGALRTWLGFHYGFGAAGVGMVIGISVFLVGQKRVLADIARAEAAAGRSGVDPKRVAHPPSPAPRGAADAPEPDEALPGLGGAAGLLSRGMPYVLGTIALAAFVVEARALVRGAVTFIGAVMPLAFGAVAVWMAVKLRSIRGALRDKSTVIFVLFFFTVLFWMAFEQAGNALNLWAELHTDRTVAGMTYPAEWFQSVNPAFILMFAPVLSALWIALGRRGREPSTPAKMLAAMVLMACSFGAMVGGAAAENTHTSRVPLAELPAGAAPDTIDAGRLSYDSNRHELVAHGVFPRFAVITALERVVPADVRREIESTPLPEVERERRLGQAAPPAYRAALEALSTQSEAARVGAGWLLLSYLLATIGELCLSPVGLSMVTKLAPRRFASLFMGVWLLGSSVAQYAAGTLGESWGIVPPVPYFATFVVTSLAGAALLLLLVRPLRKLMHESAPGPTTSPAGGAH